jgi:hypothetical protein
MALAPSASTQGLFIWDYAKFHDNLLCFRRVQTLGQNKKNITTIDLMRFLQPQEKR